MPLRAMKPMHTRWCALGRCPASAYSRLVNSPDEGEEALGEFNVLIKLLPHYT